MEISIHTRDVPPANSEYFSGYGRNEKSHGTNDAITLNLIVLKTNGYQLFFYSVDLLCVSEKISNLLTLKINELYPLQKNIIIFSATHTHSGPSFFVLPTTTSPINKKLADNLLKEAVNLAEIHKDKLIAPDRIILDQGQIEGSYGNRNKRGGYSDKSFFV